MDAASTATNVNAALEWFKKAAALGDRDAFIPLGDWCRYNPRKAEGQPAWEWYKKAVDAGVDEALVPLAQCYQRLGKKRKAFRLAQRAADEGSVQAIFLLSLWYEDGLGVAKDVHKAQELNARAQPLWDSMDVVDTELRRKTCWHIDWDRSVLERIFAPGAHEGNVRHMLALAHITNPKQAARWWDTARARGAPSQKRDAAFELGRLCATGAPAGACYSAVEQNLRKAHEMFLEALDLGARPEQLAALEEWYGLRRADAADRAGTDGHAARLKVDVAFELGTLLARVTPPQQLAAHAHLALVRTQGRPYQKARVEQWYADLAFQHLAAGAFTRCARLVNKHTFNARSPRPSDAHCAPPKR